MMRLEKEGARGADAEYMPIAVAKCGLKDILTANQPIPGIFPRQQSDAMTSLSVSGQLQRQARARRLLAFAQRSALHRHLAYVLAGWYRWFNMLPAPPARPTRLRDVAGGGAPPAVLLG